MQIITRDHRLHTVLACKSESSLWKHLLGAKFVQVISCRNRNLGIRYKKQFPVFHTNLSDTEGKFLKSRKFQRIKDIFIKLNHRLFEPSCSSSVVLRVNLLLFLACEICLIILRWLVVLMEGTVPLKEVQIHQWNTYPDLMWTDETKPQNYNDLFREISYKFFDTKWITAA